MARRRLINRLRQKKDLDAMKPGDKPLHDGGGLYHVYDSSGRRWWKFKYKRPKTYGGTETSLSFGDYPFVDLDHARNLRDEALKEIARGIDPSSKRKAETEAATNTFKAISLQWLAAGCPGGKKRTEGVGEGTIAQVTRRLEVYVWPSIGSLPIRSVEVAHGRRILQRLAKQGKLETADRVQRACDRIFRWAVAQEFADRNPFADLKGTLAPAKVKHFAAITDARQFGALLRAIDGYPGQPVTRAALQFIALTFVRPGELRNAVWGEFDLEAEHPQWVIPEERTKMRRTHVVPLSKQALEVLHELRPLTFRGSDSYVFPSLRPGRPLSENTLNMALRSMGFASEVHVSHGFRSSASSLLHEKGFDHDVIETQLAHVRAGVSGIYNRSHLLPKRRELMAAWGRYCEALKADTGGKVRAIGR